MDAETRNILERIATALEALAAAQPQTFSWTPDGLPLCPRHGDVMRKREKQGDTWYSHRVIDPATGEELFCRGYGSKSSPGWNVETDLHTPPPPTAAAKPTHPTTAKPPAPTAPAAPNKLDEYFPRRPPAV